MIIISLVTAQELIELDDKTFQRFTFIGKHYPQKDWVIAFCAEQCPNKIIQFLKDYKDQGIKRAYVNLSNNPWLQEKFSLGVFQFNQNNTMAQINIQDAQAKNLQPQHFQRIPPMYKQLNYDFWSLRMIFIHIGLVILLIFLYLVFKEGKKLYHELKIQKFEMNDRKKE